MSDQHLAIYLNDHLAGSVAALELLTHLEKANAGTPGEGFFAALRADIEGDRQDLEALMGRLHVAASPMRKATAWFVEKAAQLKLRLDDPAGGALSQLQALEAVAIGIHGKQALWCALAAVARDKPMLRETDLERLEKRAVEQRRRMERVRLEAARAALGVQPRREIAEPASNS